jgi:peptidoglycan/xylan/chitin deacetylase (PgdA/CDA1 family)
MANNVLSIAPSTNGKVTIIPNELGQKKDSISFPNLPQKVVVGCAASHLNEKKGIGNLLYMISDFKTIADIPITLELVGDIDSDLRDSYIAIINNLEISSNVVFHSYKTREELSNTMSNWDFYIQASVCEGHPNSITEALEKGHAFISSNTGFIAEQLYKEFPVLFFDSFNPKRMARQLLQLINMPNLKEFYEQSWNILERGCKKESVANKWHSLLSYDTSVPKQLGIENILAVGLHDVCGELHDSITTPITVFQQFVDFIHDGGYGLCSMRDYLGKTKEERKRYVVCTFDDGYKNLLSVAMPMLAKYGYTATVYVCTDLIGKDNKWNNKDATLRQHLDLDDIIKLKDNGWEIASHGVTHRNLLKLSDKEVEYELSESKRVLSNIVGDVMTYAYPYGSYNRFIKFCVEKYYKYAFAVSQGGTSLAIDKLQLRRYSISDIYKMLSLEK